MDVNVKLKVIELIKKPKPLHSVKMITEALNITKTQFYKLMETDPAIKKAWDERFSGYGVIKNILTLSTSKDEILFNFGINVNQALAYASHDDTFKYYFNSADSWQKPKFNTTVRDVTKENAVKFRTYTSLTILVLVITLLTLGVVIK